MAKITGIELNNFGKFSEFELRFNDKVTTLLGVNGAGKTTIGLTAIWAGLKGIAEKAGDGKLVGERFRFIGPEKSSADVKISVYDEEQGEEVVIQNHITKATNKITCKPARSAQWLSDLLDMAFLSAKHFTSLSSKDQAIALGIDTSKFDEELAELKSEYTLLNRELKSFGNPEPVKQAKKVDIVELSKKKDELVNANQEEINRVQAHNRLQMQRTEDGSRIKHNIRSLKAQIEELQQSLAKEELSLETMPAIENLLTEPTEKLAEIEEINAQIADADAVNQQYNAFLRYTEVVNQIEEKKKEVAENKADQAEVMEERLDYIKSFEFPFKDLTVTDKGELLLSERPIKSPHFSKGELEVIIAKMAVKKDPLLKFRFIDDFDLVDPENQKVIIETLLAEGFQIVTGNVVRHEHTENVIVLEECKVKQRDQGQG